jgi:hypothetical protein
VPLQTGCPKCNMVYQLPDVMLGKQVNCKQCQTAFVVQALAQGNAPIQTACPKCQTAYSFPAAQAGQRGLFLKAAVQSSGQKRTIGRCRAPRSDWRNVLLRHGIAAPNFRRRSAETVHRLPRPLRKCPKEFAVANARNSSLWPRQRRPFRPRPQPFPPVPRSRSPVPVVRQPICCLPSRWEKKLVAPSAKRYSLRRP